MTPRTLRFVVYLVVLLAIAAWRYLPRPWTPTTTLHRAHHTILSTATAEQTEEVARALELLYLAYSNRLGGLASFHRDSPRLKVKVYRDRNEMRWIHPDLDWAEAFYRKPYCHAYLASAEKNPYHWILHEATHQLNTEVACIRPARWLEEGLANYFATSRLSSNGLQLGTVDSATYPVWWLHELATSADLEENLRNGSVIPLRAILSDRGGPSMRRYFNLYYLHWWTLTHFLCHSPKYSGRVLDLIRRGGDPQACEEILGPLDPLEREWHAYVLELKGQIEGRPRLTPARESQHGSRP